jgi:hypothetical protein
MTFSTDISCSPTLSWANGTEMPWTN